MTDIGTLVYLDHNILDALIDQRADAVAQFLKQDEMKAVYSSVNLVEIANSRGYEQKFIGVLQSIGAWHLQDHTDERGLPTGIASITNKDPADVFRAHMEGSDPHGIAEWEFLEFNQKLYGGKSDISYSQIMSNTSTQFDEILSEISGDLGSLAEEADLNQQDVMQAFELLSSHFKAMSTGIANAIEQEEATSVQEIDRVTGIGPRVLKSSIKGANVLPKVWEKIKNVYDPSGSLNVDEFFIREIPHLQASKSRKEMTTAEKVGSIYQMLNFVGYYRDSKMKLPRRFQASYRDYGHAGVATYAHRFVTADEDMFMKVSAATEYLNCLPLAIYFDQNKGTLTVQVR